jgi:5-methyltetrahydrofolate--homocysteine methyltransferase
VSAALPTLPADRILVLDGAMFTLRAQRGMNATAVHEAYLQAGADIITSDTFAAATARDHTAGAGAARAIADAWTALTPDRPRFVAGSLSAGSFSAGSLGAGPAIARAGVLADRMRGLIDGGVDLVLAETLASLDEVTAVVEAAEQVGRGGLEPPPLMISVAVMASGTLPSGDTIGDLCRLLESRAPYSVGINCGFGAAGLAAPLAALAGALPCRISCHPSAGIPDAFGSFDDSPAATARFLGDAARAGHLDVAGGCCGTTPAHIAAIAEAVRGLPARMARFTA